MQTFTVGELQELIRPRKGPCVSLYMPTHRRKEGADEDRIRFKNLTSDVRERVKVMSDARTATKLVKPLEDLASSAFWRDSLDGLALFSAPEGLHWYRLPFEFPERTVVSDSFHVRPLVRFLQTRQRFHVLVLSRKGPKLYTGSRSDLVEHAVAGMPGSLESVVGEPEDREGLSSHRTGRSTIRFHGDEEARSAREDLARYCRAVDQAVRTALRDDPGPVFLAGVTRHVATFRSVSGNPSIAAEGLTGNFDRVPTETLHERILPLTESAMGARDDAALAEFRIAAGAELELHNVAKIGAAAVAGRVRTLLLCRGRSLPGAFDRATGEITKAPPRPDGLGDDVTDDLAEAVLIRGGAVHVLEPAKFPKRGGTAAAVLRW